MRLLVGLARADISIRGTSNCWYTTASDNGALQPSLVFVVSYDGDRYLVAPSTKARWARNLRAANGGELRIGRRVEPFRATRASRDVKPEVVHQWHRQTRALRIGNETEALQSLVFRIEST
jgi:hypothetical protein